MGVEVAKILLFCLFIQFSHQQFPVRFWQQPPAAPSNIPLPPPPPNYRFIPFEEEEERPQPPPPVERMEERHWSLIPTKSTAPPPTTTKAESKWGTVEKFSRQKLLNVLKKSHHSQIRETLIPSWFGSQNSV